MAGIPEHIIDQVRERTDIVEVVSKYIPLKKAGRNYKAVCPFHHEKTPSFMVSPAKQIFHCFGCGAGGNVFNFVMKYERLEFPETVRDLAKRAGVDIPVTSGQSAEKASLSETLHSINEMAMQFYQKNLLSKASSTASREYIQKRGIHPKIVEEFKIGYAPKSWSGLLEFLKDKGCKDDHLEKSGLVIKNREGRFFDRFRDKIIFPITDSKGKIKGFGSRVMDSSMPKYTNSPDTFIYNKGNHLYGLKQSWEDIRDKNAAVVVEGYLDLLTPFQHGIKNVVATLGTALTLEQVKLLKRFTDNIIILYDADAAGENAAVRSLDLLIEEELKVKVAQLPKGEDPDSYVKKHGSDLFRELLDNAQDLFDYKIGILLKRFDSNKLEGKAKIASEMLPLISKIRNAILQSGYIKRLGDLLSIDEADLKKEMSKVKPDYTYRYQPVSPLEPETAKSRMAEKILAGLMLEDDIFIGPVRGNLRCEDFQDIAIRQIVEKLFFSFDKSMKITPSKLIDLFGRDEKICACIAELIATCDNLVDRKKSHVDCIEWIKERKLKDERKALCDEIKAAQDSGDDAKVVDLVMKYSNVVKEVKV